jgi:hypothetical protein
MLRIADGLSLPTEAATETFLIVGKRGSGKSSTATRFAEQFIRSRVPIVVLDPVDVWWGLKANADGVTIGEEVYVFGGEHANLPLESTAGVLMADTIVDHRINAVFVLRQFSNKEKAHFVSDFAEQLFKRNRDVLHLFCEEAHELMPQNPYGGEEVMLGRMIRLVKLGRTSGIGVSAITQRPASLNKNATTQAEVLIAHRILGAQDVKAIDGWIEHHHQQEQRKEVLASLGELKTGEAWFWAPDFPEAQPLGLRRVNVLMPETFDSRRTPKPGERRREPKSLAPVDLAKLGEKMAATRKRAEENDPAVLRAKIRAMEKIELSVREVVKVVEKPVPVPVPVPMLKDAQIARLEKAAERLEGAGIAYAGLVNIASEIGHQIKAALIGASSTAASQGASKRTESPGSLRSRVDAAPVRAAAPAANQHRPSTDRATSRVTVRSGEPRAPSDSDLYHGKYLTEPRQKIIDVIAELDRRGIEPDRTSVARWLALHPKGGSYGENLGWLRREGYLDGWRLNGRAAPRPIADEGARGVLACLPDAPKQNALEAIIEWMEVEGRPATREEIAEKLGLHPKGGSYGENLGWLRAMKVVSKKGLAPTEGLYR